MIANNYPGWADIFAQIPRRRSSPTITQGGPQAVEKFFWFLFFQEKELSRKGT